MCKLIEHSEEGLQISSQKVDFFCSKLDVQKLNWNLMRYTESLTLSINPDSQTYTRKEDFTEDSISENEKGIWQDMKCIQLEMDVHTHTKWYCGITIQLTNLRYYMLLSHWKSDMKIFLNKMQNFENNS